MEWLYSLFFGGGIAHAVLTFALVITLGILLGKVKIGGVSLGITWILFVGIIFSHFGMTVDGEVRNFVQEFGLILFVFSIGLQVGPGFFASFKHGGMTLVSCAVAIVLLGVLTAYILHLTTGTPIPTMVGILSGAVTNTPGLGAAQQAYADATGCDDPSIALGYAVAYPLGVVGIIFTMIFIRYAFRVKFEKEDEALAELSHEQKFADKVGGVVGSSRACVDAGWIDHSHQVGQTGTTVKPKIYFACGISGSVQHRAGMDQSGKIININTDPEAPMNAIADYVINGSVMDVLPKMIKYYKANSK